MSDPVNTLPIKLATAPYGGAPGDHYAGVLAYEAPNLVREVDNKRLEFWLELDSTILTDTRPGNNLHQYHDSYLDSVYLPFAKPETVLVNGVAYVPDQNGQIVFYDRASAPRIVYPGGSSYTPPGGDPNMTGRLRISYEINWDVIDCEAEEWAGLDFTITNYSRTDDGIHLGRGTSGYYLWVRLKAADFCDRLKQALLDGGYITPDGHIRLDLMNGQGIAYDSSFSPVEPASPGYGWSLPNHYRRVEIIQNGHLVYKDGATSLLRWRKSGDSYLPVEPKNLVQAGLLDDERFVPPSRTPPGCTSTPRRTEVGSWPRRTGTGTRSPTSTSLVRADSLPMSRTERVASCTSSTGATGSRWHFGMSVELGNGSRSSSTTRKGSIVASCGPRSTRSAIVRS